MGVLDSVPSQPRVADAVYERLYTAVIGRHIEPGERLSIPNLAEQLGVSRSPVREAVQRLVQDGLATEEPRRGAVVATLDLSDVLPLYELREVLEGFAARLASDRADAKEISSLEQVVTSHRKAVEEGDRKRQIELDMLFHKGVREASRNSELAGTLERVQGRITIAMLSSEESWHAQALAEHEAILAALRDRSADEAERLAVAHIARVRTDLSRQRAEPDS